MTISVGEVVSIAGVKVTVRVFEDTSKDTLFYNGEKYKGISIREYLSIRRGFRNIVCLVEGEYLDEHKVEEVNSKQYFVRKVELRPIGYFENDSFHQGIKYLPMIKDPAYLVSEDTVSMIYGHDDEKSLVIGNMLKEELPISLPWKNLFNTHIGIFGNTGSGKSNTLANLLTVLFHEKKEGIKGKSQFILVDFNGEYTKDQLIEEGSKSVINLSTRDDTGNRFPLIEREFWNRETLCILFKATANTQAPFINRLINGRERFGGELDTLKNYITTTFRRAFISTSQRRETKELLKAIVKIIKPDLEEKLDRLIWRGDQNKFTYPWPEEATPTTYFDGDELGYKKVFGEDVDAISTAGIDAFDELTVRVNLQLINDLLYGYVQFEHIQPLLKRIESSMSGFKRVITVGQANIDNRILTVISLRKCNQEIKKVIPLLIAKHYYEQHKDEVENPPNRTLHLVIDEAHNILSEQSNREEESWKDYRLELFEEIIKEGRKFGMFLMLSSQRPADISPTIMSQIHNFFIHRLANDKDLFLIDNSISTLDSISKSMIPNLSKGCCIVTGTSFELPLVMQVNLLDTGYRPDSEDVDLGELWT